MLVCQQFKCTWAQRQPRTKQIQETNSAIHQCEHTFSSIYCSDEMQPNLCHAILVTPKKIVTPDVGVVHYLNTS